MSENQEPGRPFILEWLELFSNSHALASFVKCGFYLKKMPLNGLFSEYTYW
jgi:hypothetical protein